MNDHGPGVERWMLDPVSHPPQPIGPSDDERAGRLVAVGLLTALVLLAVGGLLWWATDPEGARSDALADPSAEATVAPPTAPPTSADVRDAAVVAASAGRLSSPPDASGVVAQMPPAPSSEDVAPAAPAETELAIADTPETSELPTTSAVTTTTEAVPTTLSRVVASTTSVPVTTVPPSTLAAIVSPTTTAPPAPTSTTPTTSPPTTTTSVADAPPDHDVLTVLTDSPDLARFAELVELSGTADVLAAEDVVTAFAPSNEAVDAFAATEQGAAVLADETALRDLVLRHLVPAELDEQAIFDHTWLDALNGDRLAVRTGSHTVDGAALLAEIAATDGYVHIVSDVLTGA